jgi:hypothetical protein
MIIFFVCLYVVAAIFVFVVTSKHNKLTRELIDILFRQNDLLEAQNKKLRDIIKKYDIN